MAFDLQGHRGARGLAPENTLPAFVAALAIGVTTLELDLGMTRDGVLVVHHDVTLNPDTTRGPDGNFLPSRGPPVRALTLAELRTYDVGRLRPGAPYGLSFPAQSPVDGATVPTLEDVFALVRDLNADHVRFNIETKLTPSSGAETADPETFAAAVAAAIRTAGLTRRASVQSFDWRTLVAMRRIAPEIVRVCLSAQGERFDTMARNNGPSPWTAGLDIAEHGGSVPRLAAAAGCAVWSPSFRDLTPEGIADARAASVKIIPWNVNERADMERLIDLGVDGIITDYPDRLRALMAGRGMPLPPKMEGR